MTQPYRSLVVVALLVATSALSLGALGCGKKQTLQRPPVDLAPPAPAEHPNLRTQTEQRGAYVVDVPVIVEPTPTPAPQP